jgi:hypothetical protein
MYSRVQLTKIAMHYLKRVNSCASLRTRMSLRSTAKYVRGGPPTSDTQVTEGEPVMLVFELMENGSLFDFLKEVWCSFSLFVSLTTFRKAM